MVGFVFFAFVFSSRKHRENVFIWCIYLTRLVLVLMHHHGPLHSVLVQADLMIALVAVIRDLLCEFLSKSLSEKPR